MIILEILLSIWAIKVFIEEPELRIWFILGAIVGIVELFI